LTHWQRKFFANMMPNEGKWSRDRLRVLDLDLQGPIDNWLEDWAAQAAP